MWAALWARWVVPWRGGVDGWHRSMIGGAAGGLSGVVGGEGLCLGGGAAGALGGGLGKPWESGPAVVGLYLGGLFSGCESVVCLVPKGGSVVKSKFFVEKNVS